MESSGEVLHNLRSRKIFSPRTIKCQKEVSLENRKEQILKKAREENLTFAQRVTRNARPKCAPNPEYAKRQKEEDILCAMKALQHFNSKEGTRFELVRVQNTRSNTNCPFSNMHMNFTARSSKGGMEEQFFTSLFIPDRVGPVESSEVCVGGCCLLKKVSDPDLRGLPCVTCGDVVIHPGPRSGYEVVSGDRFEQQRFQKLNESVIPEQHDDIMVLSLMGK